MRSNTVAADGGWCDYEPPRLKPRRKGTRVHRRIGRGYVLSMLLLNITAMMIYDLYGRFGPFHVASVISLATVGAGYVPVYLRRPRAAWIQLHATFMCWSYVGLLAAFVSEVAVRVPGVGFGYAVVAATVVIVVGGAVLIHTRVPRILVAFTTGGLTGAAPVGTAGNGR